MSDHPERHLSISGGGKITDDKWRGELGRVVDDAWERFRATPADCITTAQAQAREQEGRMTIAAAVERAVLDRWSGMMEEEADSDACRSLLTMTPLLRAWAARMRGKP